MQEACTVQGHQCSVMEAGRVHGASPLLGDICANWCWGGAGIFFGGLLVTFPIAGTQSMTRHLRKEGSFWSTAGQHCPSWWGSHSGRRGRQVVGAVCPTLPKQRAADTGAQPAVQIMGWCYQHSGWERPLSVNQIHALTDR